MSDLAVGERPRSSPWTCEIPFGVVGAEVGSHTAGCVNVPSPARGSHTRGTGAPWPMCCG